MPGIVTSRRIKSGLSGPLAMASAFSPLVAILVRKESFSKPETTATLVGVSSTTSTSFLLAMLIAFDSLDAHCVDVPCLMISSNLQPELHCFHDLDRLDVDR